METTYNDNTVDFQQQVQALICLNAFDSLCAKAGGQYRIVPLKGIDLMRFLYADTLDRELKDIDLLITPADRALDFIHILLKDGYKAEFSHALDKTALDRKKKVSMLSPSDRMPNVDVHIALITKRFFSETINGFNQDVIARLQPVNEVVSVLDEVDRWLFLATHLTFHFLEGEKWYRDLALLSERFNDTEKATLVYRTKHYNMERMVASLSVRLHTRYPDIVLPVEPMQLLTSESDRRFMRYLDAVTANTQQLEHGFKLARYYWEFVFISKKEHRHRAFLSLLFPSIGTMQNIYRCHVLPAILLYVPHLLINSIGLLLFAAKYRIVSSSYHH